MASRVVRVRSTDDGVAAHELRDGIAAIQAELKVSPEFPAAVEEAASNAAAAPRLPELDRTDIPFVTTALVHQCSDQSFPIAPPQVQCDTKDQHPQTFRANVARGRYYNEKFGKDKLHGVYVFGNDSKQARDSSFVSLGALRDIGIKSDQDFDISGRAQQSAPARDAGPPASTLPPS